MDGYGYLAPLVPGKEQGEEEEVAGGAAVDVDIGNRIDCHDNDVLQSTGSQSVFAGEKWRVETG